MTGETQRLLEAVLKLPHTDRAEIFERLGASLADDEPITAAWRDELRARVARLDAGEMELLDVEDVVRDLLADQQADERRDGK